MQGGTPRLRRDLVPARTDSELSHVNPLTVGRVQVVKGPYALAWPAGALSTIDVITWAPEFSTLGRGSVSCALALDHGDNVNTSNGIARLSGATEKFRHAVTVGRRSGDDYDNGSGQMRLRGRNLTDEAYACHLNSKNPFNGMRILEPGRSLFLGLSFRP